MAAPTFVSEAESTWDVLSSGITTPSFATTAADILVALAANEGNTAEAITNSGTALTWTTRQDVGFSGFSRALAATATANTDPALTVTTTSSTGHHGVNALTFRNSGGVGASAQAHTSGAPSLSITTTQANSALVVLVVDFNAVSGASRTWRTVNGTTPTAGNGFELTYFTNASLYTVYIAYYPDAGAVGAKTVGLSAPTGQQYSIVAVEVKGSAGGTDGTVTAVPMSGTGDIPVPTVTADAPRTSPVAAGTGDIPAPAVAGTGDASVTSPAIDGAGDLVTPTLEADSSVTAPPVDGTGDLVTPAQALSAEVDPGPMSGTGNVSVPAVSGSSAGSVTAPPLDGTGDLVTPTVQAGSTETAPPLDGVGDVPTPTVSAGNSGTVTAPPIDGTGDLVTPAMAAGSTVTSPHMAGTGDMGAANAHGPSLRAGEVSTGALEPTYHTGAVEVALGGTGGGRAGVASTSATEPTFSTGAVEQTGDRGALEVVF